MNVMKTDLKKYQDENFAPIDYIVEGNDYYVLKNKDLSKENKNSYRIMNVRIEPTSINQLEPYKYVFTGSSTYVTYNYNDMIKIIEDKFVLSVNDYNEKFPNVIKEIEDEQLSDLQKTENYILSLEEKYNSGDYNDKYLKKEIDNALDSYVNYYFSIDENNNFTEEEKYEAISKIINWQNKYNTTNYLSLILQKNIDTNLDFNSEKSFWQYLKENNKISNYHLKPIDYKINPSDKGISKIFKKIVWQFDNLRPTMSGVNFEGNRIIGTDAHKLLHITGKKDGKFEDGIYCLSDYCKKKYPS